MELAREGGWNTQENFDGVEGTMTDSKGDGRGWVGGGWCDLSGEGQYRKSNVARY